MGLAAAVVAVMAAAAGWRFVPALQGRGQLNFSVLSAVGGVGVLAAIAARTHVSWLPWWYPAVLLLSAVMAIDAARSGAIGMAVLATMVFVAALPVPWETTRSAGSGTAWRLDERIRLDDRRLDPPGRWLWLTVGRPLTVGEIIAQRRDPSGSLRADARTLSRPAINEAAAAVVGIRAAGLDVNAAVTVEMTWPTRADLPAVFRVATVDGRPVTTASDWYVMAEAIAPGSVLVGQDGTRVVIGEDLGYRLVDVIERPDFDVTVGGALAHTAAGRWWRNQGAGASHGVLIALVAYGDASGVDLARGRTIAGTGAIAPDGTLRRIGGLRDKAAAAARAGADVLVFPSAQAIELADFDPGRMQLLGANDLDSAILGLLKAT
jgi:hypothetical protein